VVFSNQDGRWLTNGGDGKKRGARNAHKACRANPLTTLLVAACVTFFLAAWVVLARADSADGLVSPSSAPRADNSIVLAQTRLPH